jgi:TonB family protein
MDIADLQYALLEAAAYGGAALLLVLTVRRPLRLAFGTGPAYLSWAVVPLATLSGLLPAVTVLPAMAVVPSIAEATAAVVGLSPRSGAPTYAWIVPAVWSVGALSTAGLLGWRQLCFVRALGRLTVRDDGTHVAQSSAGLPAVIGILRPRIVLPADHAVRFDASQQELVRDHELVHIVRGDQVWNLLALILRCMFWFNPLVYWAAPRFRQDQELACDAKVISRQPQARRAYGEALMRAQIPFLTAPLSCQMGFAHPLKERIAMLKQPTPSFARRASGATLVVVLATIAGFTANAAQPETDRPARLLYVPWSELSFPPEAEAQRLSGKVFILLEYNENGEVVSTTVQSSNPAGIFDDAALRMARSIRVRPASKGGIPVAGRVVLPVLFEWKPRSQ